MTDKFSETFERDNAENKDARIEELRVAVSLREWAITSWRDAKWTAGYRHSITPQDLANAYELHDLICERYHHEAVQEHSHAEPDDEESDEWYEWGELMLSIAIRKARVFMYDALGWHKYENEWNTNKSFRDEFSHLVSEFDAFLTLLLNSGKLAHTIISWYELTEEQRNEQHRLVGFVKELQRKHGQGKSGESE